MIGFDELPPNAPPGEPAPEEEAARPNRRLARIVFRNSAFGLAGQMAIRVLSFGFSVLIVRHLGAEDYGQYAAVLAFGAIFVFLGDLGLSPYAVREVARWRDAPDGAARIDALYSNVLVLRLALSALTAVLLVVAAWLTGRPLVMIGAIGLGALGLIMYGPEGASEAVLSGFERIDLTSKAKVLQQVAFVLVGAAALWLGAGYYGLIVANLLGIALLTYICWTRARGLGVHVERIDLRVWPTLLRASIPFGIIGFALGLSYKFDSVLLDIFRGDVETGYYNAAYNLIFSAVVVSNVVNTALYPSLTRHATAAAETLPRIYERALRYLLMLALPMAVGGWVLAGQIVPFLFTRAYLLSVPALRILIWVVPFMFASEFLGYVVVIQGKERFVARSVMVSTGLNLLLNLVLVPRFGLFGASVMTVATEIVLVGQYVWLLRALMRRLDWGRVLVRPLLAALLMGGLLELLPGLPLPASVAAGAAAYLALLFLLRVIGAEERTFVVSLVRKTPVPTVP